MLISALIRPELEETVAPFIGSFICNKCRQFLSPSIEPLPAFGDIACLPLRRKAAFPKELTRARRTTLYLLAQATSRPRAFVWTFIKMAEPPSPTRLAERGREIRIVRFRSFTSYTLSRCVSASLHSLLSLLSFLRLWPITLLPATIILSMLPRRSRCM
jgi:hypothetical protein